MLWYSASLTMTRFALLLGAVQRLVGELNQAFQGLRLSMGSTNAAPMLTVSRLATRDASCGMFSFRDRALYSRQHFGHVLAARLVQHHRKLLAAVARHEIQRTAARTDSSKPANRAQAFIAGLVSISIVVVLEAIDVREPARQPLLIAHALLPNSLNVLVETCAGFVCR